MVSKIENLPRCYDKDSSFVELGVVDKLVSKVL